MARRTVENINGFVMARPAVSKKLPSRTSNPVAAVGGTKKTIKIVPTTVRTANAGAVLPIKKNDPSVRSRYTKDYHQKTKTEEEKVIPPYNVLTVDNVSIDGSLEINEDQDYEDDFEDYESDFESDTSVASLLSQHVNRQDSKEEVEKFALPVCVEEQLEPFLDETFEVNVLERTIERGLSNFKSAGKRQREQEAKSKIKTRGNILMEMIKLDTVSFSLFDMPAIPYEQYIQIYGQSNMSQVYTQTNDDYADKEIQTTEIDLSEKWTQRPIFLPNTLDCSSFEYLQAKLGVGANSDISNNKRVSRVNAVDADRICTVGRVVLRWLERQAMDNIQHKLLPNQLAFSNGHLRPSISAVRLLADQPVTSVEFMNVTPSDSAQSLVTVHEVSDKTNWYATVCIWNASDMDKMPEYILKCPNRVTCLCTLPKNSGEGFVVAAHVDGSICVWDLRESRFHHEQLEDIQCPLRSPSYNTALIFDNSHKSKVVGLRPVTYSNVKYIEKEFPNELCSLDEDFVLIVWTVMDSWTGTAESVGQQKYGGTAPWSSVRLVKLQTITAKKDIPKQLSDGATATSMCLSNRQDSFMGTNSGLVFRSNLGGHKIWPSYYTCGYTGEHHEINWLEVCPFDSNYFLAASSSGGVILYNVRRQEALRRYLASASVLVSPSIVKAQWCTGHPGIVFALDSLSSVHVWDLCDDTTFAPLTSAGLREKNITSIAVAAVQSERQPSYVSLAFTDGKVEMHMIKLEKRNLKTQEDHRNTLLRSLSRL
ncbi:uncharacterized protein LOC126841031 [Adelges cooleyi]|uniref:uncharacterized protein LOC126841031 n=1 Tax=Adelges cooleyi TaxID=133065 RepID=UPI002180397F|nr:uncharacterized protein LOC126841031 [Adelges cooleyi]